MTTEPTELPELRDDIRDTRAALGDTLSALSGKFDVKARAGRALSDVRESVHDKASGVRHTVSELPVVAVLLGIAATAAVAILIWRTTKGRSTR